jgi:hypothetical protein
MGTHFFWTYIVGPFAALLPAPWRKLFPNGLRLDWERAATVSGFLEMVAAVVGLGFWYMFDVTRRMSQITDALASGQITTGLNEHQVAGSVLTIFYMNVLTWILLYFFFEGAVRLCGAAFAENVLGTTPLFVLERILFLIWNRKTVKPWEVVTQNAKSFVQSLREREMVATLEQVPDELHYSTGGPDGMLEIWASRRKLEWVPPKIVRVDESFYRLEDSTVEQPPRPFHYRLRHLEAGVSGRNVLLYKTSDSSD